MGLYINERRVVKYMHKNTHISYVYADAAKIIAGNITLKEPDVKEALDLAIDSQFVKPPNKDEHGNYVSGEACTVTEKGKRYLKRRYISVFDEYIGSFKSSPNLLAVIAIIISILVAIFK